MSRFAAVVTTALLFPIGMGTAAAQAPSTTFQRLPGDIGLSHNSVYAIAQDRAGFLWFGTADGLNRYDGYEVRVFRHDPQDSTSLSNSLIRAILPDPERDLWIATPDGLSRFDTVRETARRYPLTARRGVAARRALSLHRTLDGILWVGTDAGLFRHDAEADTFVPVYPVHPDSLPSSIYAIQEAPDRTLWLLVGQSGSWQLIALRAGEATNRFRLHPDWQGLHYDDMHVDRGGGIWLTAEGPARLDSSLGLALPPRGGDPGLAAWSTAVAKDGGFWVGTSTGVVRVASDRTPGALQPLDNSRSGYLFNFVRAVFEDAAGTVWVGTHGGIYRADPHAKPFRHIASDPNQPTRLSSNAISAIAEHAGALWLGTFGAGLNRLDQVDSTVRHYRHIAGDSGTLPDDVIGAILPARDGRLWVAAGNGIGRLDPQSGRYHGFPLPRAEPGSRSGITAADEDSAGRIWLAGRTSLLRIDPATATTRLFRPPEGGAGGTPLTESVLVVDDTTIWVGLSPAELWRLDPRTGNSTRYPLRDGSGRPLQSEAIWSLQRGADGALWIGTGVGLLEFTPPTGAFRFYAPQDGLPGSVIYGVLPGDHGELWLGTNRGLSRLDPAAAEPTFRNFGLADGVQNTEFNRHASARGGDGTLYFGGIDGLTSFVPGEVTENPVVPPVVLTRVETASRAGVRVHNPRALESLSLSYRDYALSFEFAALSFTNPGQNRYAHRLEGFDADWVETGTRRYARYTNLRAGDYVLRVRGSNNDGAWNEAGVVLAIHVTPPFWQATWFRLLVLLAFVGAAWLAFRARVARLLAIERLRLRIAGDLHDDLSSNLVGIALLGERLERSPGMAEESRGQLTRITETARRAVTDLRDIVWLVDPSRDHVSDLVLRLREDAGALFPGGECEVSATVAGREGRIGPALRRQLYLACKEAMHNAARHAGAAAVHVTITEQGGWMVVRIADDGRGFDGGGGGRWVRAPQPPPAHRGDRRRVAGHQRNREGHPGRNPRTTHLIV